MTGGAFDEGRFYSPGDRLDTGGTCPTEGWGDNLLKWFRPFTILILTIGVTAGFFLDKIDAIAFFGFATGLVVWWFRSRDHDKQNGGNVR